jgi:nitroimidazol reductase NimA-like FMN-containing flavoprotein (pyridoxamine 5'-phosphate oxidase superfamily)
MTETAIPTTEDLDVRASWELLRSHTYGRVAVTHLGQPEIYPVNYLVMQGRIRFATAPGAKLLGVLLDGRVAFEIDGIEGDTAWSVLVKGTADEVRLSPDRSAPPLVPDAPWVPSPRDAVVDITPAEVTGRRFHRAG